MRASRWVVVATVCVLAAAISLPLLGYKTILGGGGPPTSLATGGEPPQVCGTSNLLNSPYSYDGPAGTVTESGSVAGLPTFGGAGTSFPTATRIVIVPAGNNTAAANNGNFEANHTMFYFEPGEHVVQSIMYTGDNSVYVGGYTAGAGRAIIDGVNGATPNGLGGSYLSLSSTGVADANDVWEYLTIKNFTASQNNVIMGNENGAGFDNGNTYKYNTIGPNDYGYNGDSQPPRVGESSAGGYAIGLGDNTTIEYNCLTHNAQGAFNGGGLSDVISHNEISWNGLGEYPDTGGPGGSPFGCGCSGGGKLFFSVNAQLTYNYVHDNYNTGIWLDFDNTGANISDNYISGNWGSGISYEASYNANISHNTLVGNGWGPPGKWPAGVRGLACYGDVPCTSGAGPITGAGGGFPYSALDLASSAGNQNLGDIKASGCNCTVRSNYSGKLLVQDNVLLNNFGGVGIYTDTNRYPGNIDNDSACSIPLGALNQPNNTTYYQQTKELYTKADATVSGTLVTSVAGATTLCDNYGKAQNDGGQQNVPAAPYPGMAVFNIDTGAFIGTVASVSSATAFKLSKPAPVSASRASLLLSAYGGCGPADYFGGGPGRKSGIPAAYYWDNCIWGSRNVTISGNRFIMQADQIAGCDTKNMCGYMINAAFNAGVPTLMQFFDSYPSTVAHAKNGLGNRWSHNAYAWSGGGSPGQWQFWAGLQGTSASWEGWRAAPNRQDSGSSFTPGA